jgi:hypothetical protein
MRYEFWKAAAVGSIGDFGASTTTSPVSEQMGSKVYNVALYSTWEAK